MCDREWGVGEGSGRQWRRVDSDPFQSHVTPHPVVSEAERSLCGSGYAPPATVSWPLFPGRCLLVTVRNRPLTSSVHDALAGSGVETAKKGIAGNSASAKGGADARKLYKLENDSETFAHETVSSSLKKQIQSARLAKKMTQAQLAQAINEKPQIINEYESGKAIPNPQVLSKMSRVLGVKLKKSG